MGFLPPLFPPRLHRQLRPLLSARPLALHPSTPPASPSPHSARSVSPPPPPRSGLPPPLLPALFGEGASARGTDKRAQTDLGAPYCSSPPRGPHPPGAGAAPLFAFQPEVRGVRLPLPSFPGLVRANRLAAGAEPPGASDTKECTGRRVGGRSKDRGSSLGSQTGDRAPEREDSGLAAGRFLVCEDAEVSNLRKLEFHGGDKVFVVETQ